MLAELLQLDSRRGQVQFIMNGRAELDADLAARIAAEYLRLHVRQPQYLGLILANDDVAMDIAQGLFEKDGLVEDQVTDHAFQLPAVVPSAAPELAAHMLQLDSGIQGRIAHPQTAVPVNHRRDVRLARHVHAEILGHQRHRFLDLQGPTGFLQRRR